MCTPRTDDAMTHPEDARGLIREHLDLDHLEERLTGRDGGLRVSKPTTEQDTGLTQYVWRMARFHSGRDPRMPVTAHWWLSTYLDEHTSIEASVSGILDDAGEAVLDVLDAAVTEVLFRFGEDPAGGAKRWQCAGLF